MRYRLTTTGRKALETGDELVRIAQEVAEDGVITPKEFTKYGLTETEGDYVISLLSRLGFIEVLPYQNVSYSEGTRRN